MSPDRWIVTAAALAAIAFIVWFFWLKRHTGFRADESGGFQIVNIAVKGGYTPDTIVVQRDRPVRLNFRREESSACSEKVVLRDFQRSADLPQGQTVAVEFLPKEPGTFEFTCGMGMLRGRVIVE